MQANNNTMKKFITPAALFLLAALLNCCSAIAGIFRAGAAVGVIAAAWLSRSLSGLSAFSGVRVDTIS